MFGAIGFPELVIFLFFFGIIIWPWSRICSKAGYSPWCGLIALVPAFGYIGLMLFLAFAEWPIQRAAKGRATTP